MQNQEVREPTRSALIVAPIWLQNVLSLWLQADGKVTWVICAATFKALPLASLAVRKSEEGKHVRLVPDLVIFFTPQEQAAEQVQKIKLMWPMTTLLVLADVAHRLCRPTETELREAGADLLLPKEFSPEQFLNVVIGILSV